MPHAKCLVPHAKRPAKRPGVGVETHPHVFLASGSPCNRIGVRLGIHKTTSGKHASIHMSLRSLSGVHLALKCSLSTLWESANSHSHQPCRVFWRLGTHKTTSGNANTPHQPPFLGVHLALKCSLSTLWERANAHSHQPCRVFWRLGAHATTSGERANTHHMRLRSLSGAHLGQECSL